MRSANAASFGPGVSGPTFPRRFISVTLLALHGRRKSRKC